MLIHYQVLLIHQGKIQGMKETHSEVATGKSNIITNPNVIILQPDFLTWEFLSIDTPNLLTLYDLSNN